MCTKFKPLIILFLSGLLVSGTYWNNNHSVIISVTKEIGPEGGSLSIEPDDNGQFVTLDIPDGALREKTTITIKLAEKQLAGPLSNPLIKGIIIEPKDLLLDKEAELQIGSPEEITEKTIAYSIENASLVIPIADQKVEIENYMITGNIFCLGSFCISNPTKQEAITQSTRLKAYNFGVPKQTSNVIPASGNLLAYLSTDNGYESDLSYPLFELPSASGNCLSWQNTVKKVRGYLWWETYHRMNNDNQLGDNEEENAKEALQEAIDDFLSKPIPGNPCTNYINAASKYLEASILLGLESEEGNSTLNQRFADAVDKCSFRFNVEMKIWVNHPRETNKDGVSFEEKLNEYGLLECYLPWGHFLSTGEGRINGKGTISYNYEKHSEAEESNSHKTIKGKLDVYKVEGTLKLHVDEHGVQQKYADVTFYLKKDLTTRMWGKPGLDDDPYDWSGKDNETTSLPFMCEVENGHTDMFGNETVGHLYKVYLIKLPGDGRVNDDDCY